MTRRKVVRDRKVSEKHNILDITMSKLKKDTCSKVAGKYEQEKNNSMDWNVIIEESESGDSGQEGQRRQVSENKSDSERRSTKEVAISKEMTNVERGMTVENRDTKTTSIDRYKKMVRINGVLKYVENEGKEGGQVEVAKEGEDRFKSSYKGRLIVVAVLNARYRSYNKESNVNKIMNYLVKKGIKVESIKGEGFGKAEIVFFDVVQANKCLDLDKGQEDPFIKFVIPNRVRKVKGIIADGTRICHWMSWWQQEITLKILQG